MSITYDPEKWSHPMRAREFEPLKKKQEGPVLVSLRELRYFKEAASAIENNTVSISTFIEGISIDEGENNQAGSVE